MGINHGTNLRSSKHTSLVPGLTAVITALSTVGDQLGATEIEEALKGNVGALTRSLRKTIQKFHERKKIGTTVRKTVPRSLRLAFGATFPGAREFVVDDYFSGSASVKKGIPFKIFGGNFYYRYEKMVEEDIRFVFLRAHKVIYPTTHERLLSETTGGRVITLAELWFFFTVFAYTINPDSPLCVKTRIICYVRDRFGSVGTVVIAPYEGGWIVGTAGDIVVGSEVSVGDYVLTH
jgi:hypothetical protein